MTKIYQLTELGIELTRPVVQCIPTSYSADIQHGPVVQCTYPIYCKGSQFSDK